MMRYKKIIIGTVALLFLAVSVFMIYNVNSVFPNTEDKAYRTGDETRYRGLKLTVGEIEVYTEEEAVEKYPAIKDTQLYETDKGKFNYVIANITLENDTDDVITFGKFGSVGQWCIEAGLEGNGMSYFDFLALNPTYHKSFSVGDKQDIILPFTLSKKWITYEELKKEDIKIIYSFYPEKIYILYEGKKK